MEILVNDHPTSIADQITLDEFIKNLQRPDTQSIAVAVNDTLIPRSSWRMTVLQSGDAVIIIQPTPGG